MFAYCMYYCETFIKDYTGNYVTIWESFQIMLPGEGQWQLVFVQECWPWVGEICKCFGANAWGFPGVSPLGWPPISALSIQWFVQVDAVCKEGLREKCVLASKFLL